MILQPTAPRTCSSTTVAAAESCPAGQLPSANVIDLQSARDARRPRLKASGWACPECGLSTGPYAPEEATVLAAVHDLVMRHPLRTAQLLPRPATVAGS